MLILLNLPMVTVLLFILLLLFLKSNNNRYGISLSFNAYQRLINKENAELDIIDIRNKDRFEESHTNGCRHYSTIEAVQNDGAKLIIVHDSEIELADFFRKHKLKQFSDNIYRTNMIEHNLKQYQLAVVGASNGNNLSALIKNSDSAS